MTRLLIYEPSFRRIEARLAAHGDALKPLLMGEDGSLTLAGHAIAVDEAKPRAAWANAEVFESSVSREFMIALLKAPGLQWLQSAAAGFDHPVFSQLARKGVRLTTSHGQAVGMADYVLAGVLDHFQRGAERRAAQAQRAWRRLPFRELMGSRWLIVGFGAIGQAVAQRARAFGGIVTGIRRDPSPHPLAEAIAPLERLCDLAADADVLVLCIPLNQATRRIAGARLFAAMRAGSVLVNVGRGGLVDEAALVAALDKGAPGHAVLDVFETEPLPPESPLWTHPAVSVTAHASGVTAGPGPRNQELFLDNLARYLAGEPLLHEVDPADLA
ncbi:MAG TPA: D-2-hydroxyacid dehydrogenase [Caulobacteraceae bacterium]